MVANGELTFNNLTIGGTSAYIVTSVDGLDAPGIRLESSDKAVSHGSFTYAMSLEPRTVVITGSVASPVGQTVTSYHYALRGAFQPQTSALPLSFMIPPDDSAKRIYAVPTHPASFTLDNSVVIGQLNYTVQLIAGDPRIYSDTETTTAVSSGGSSVVNNTGTFPSPPTIVTTGSYGGSVTFTNSTQSRAVTLTGLSGSGVITVDFANHTIIRGSENLYGKLSSASVWWELGPGNNTVGSTGVAINVKHRSAWI